MQAPACWGGHGCPNGNIHYSADASQMQWAWCTCCRYAKAIAVSTSPLRKKWLQREGIRVDAFEQRGTALTNSKAIVADGVQRRDDTLIAFCLY